MRVFILLALWSFCALGTKQQNETESNDVILSQDIIRCIEKEKCGLKSICSFGFSKFHTRKSNKDLSEGKGEDFRDPCNGGYQPLPKKVDGVLTTPKPVLDDMCVPIAEGTIFGVTNALDYPLTFDWDVMDKGIAVGLVSKPKISGKITVPPKSTRYFTDGIQKTHTARLKIGGEVVDRVVSEGGLKCSVDDTCDLLYRLCYQNQLDLDEDPSIINNDEQMCKIYKNECNGFSKIKKNRETDLLNYLKTHFPSIVSPTTKIDSETVLEALIDAPDYKEFKLSKGHLLPTTTPTPTTSSAGFITAVVILSLFIMVLVTLMICWVPYCKPAYWKNYMESSQKIEEGDTLQTPLQSHLQQQANIRGTNIPLFG